MVVAADMSTTYGGLWRLYTLLQLVGTPCVRRAATAARWTGNPD